MIIFCQVHRINICYNIFHILIQNMIPGPPFAFGAILVIMALMVAIFIPENPSKSSPRERIRRLSAKMSPNAHQVESGMHN